MYSANFVQYIIRKNQAINKIKHTLWYNSAFCLLICAIGCNDNTIKTIMDIPDKIRDNVKARVDHRPMLDMAPPRAGKSWRKPKAEFILMRPPNEGSIKMVSNVNIP